MKRLFGIAYTLDIDWISEKISDFEFNYKEKSYLFGHGTFYHSVVAVDDQGSDWEEVENKELLLELEKVLLETEKIETAFLEYVEKQLVELFEENDIINTIKEIKNI